MIEQISVHKHKETQVMNQHYQKLLIQYFRSLFRKFLKNHVQLQQQQNFPKQLLELLKIKILPNRKQSSILKITYTIRIQFDPAFELRLKLLKNNNFTKIDCKYQQHFRITQQKFKELNLQLFTQKNYMHKGITQIIKKKKVVYDLTDQEVKDCYYYYQFVNNPNRCYMYIDAIINLGSSRATHILQNVCKIKIDGIFDDLTLKPQIHLIKGTCNQNASKQT